MVNKTTFQYFTYFLSPLDQQRLFVDKRDKNEIFRDFLRGGKVEYEGRGVKLVLVLVSERKNIFICKLGKKASIKRHLPPDQNFEEALEESWPFCWVVINTSPDQGDGQKIAFEYKSSVFTSPHEQLKHFENKVNEALMNSGYALAVNPVTEEQEFWKIIQERSGGIERLTFTFNVPNLFGLEDSLTRDLKELQRVYGSTRVTVGLENPIGKLKIPKNKLTNQSVNYITRGGGEYELRIKGMTKKIRSKNRIYTKTFDDLTIHLKKDGQAALLDILGQIF